MIAPLGIFIGIMLNKLIFKEKKINKNNKMKPV